LGSSVIVPAHALAEAFELDYFSSDPAEQGSESQRGFDGSALP
jgi:hypothetical protein